MKDDVAPQVWQPSETSRRVAATWLVDRLAAEVIQALTDRGVGTIYLKGRSLAEWLYDPAEVRAYSDIDLLVAPGREHQVARQVLKDLRFEPVLVGLIRDDRPYHAHSWRRPGTGIEVDLHHTLPRVRADPPTVWSTLSSRTEVLEVGGAVVEALSVPARAFHVALHAGQHGVQHLSSAEDLRRALLRLDAAVWREASEVAGRLDALPFFAAGLRQSEEGERLLTALGLAREASVDSILSSRKDPGFPEAFEWVSQTRGPGRKLLFVMRKVFPSPAYMRALEWDRPEGGRGLAMAYVRRFLWVLGRSGSSFRAWRKAREEVAAMRAGARGGRHLWRDRRKGSE